ncbi:hypothetical protein J3A83DRAFT_4331332 [Scleroderma citrinum]
MKPIGLHFNVDLVIDRSCGVLYQILTQAFHVNEPVLSVHTSFGEARCLNAPLDLHNFIMEGVFRDLTISPISGLRLTSIGVRLIASRGFSLSPEPHSSLSFSFGIFGEMNLATLSSTTLLYGKPNYSRTPLNP